MSGEKQKFYFSDGKGGITFKSVRKPGFVATPNYVYDLWMPLIGGDAVGVYGVLCRLEMAGSVKRMTLSTLAAACCFGYDRFCSCLDRLEDCGFIKVNKPKGQARLMHWTTEIVVYDPPTDVSVDKIKKYHDKKGPYRALSWWLMEVDDPLSELLKHNSGVAETQLRTGLGPDSNIEDLDILKTFIIEKNTPAMQAEPQMLATQEPIQQFPLASLAGASPLCSDAVFPASGSEPGQASGNGHVLEDARGEGVGGEGQSPSTPPIAAAAPPSTQMAGGRAVGGDGHAPVSGDEADSPILPKGNPNGFGHVTASLANYWWQFVGRLPNESEFRATRKTMRELLALDAKGKPVAGRKGYAPDEIKACIDGFRECGVVNENTMMIGWHIEAFLKDDKPWPPSGAQPRTQRLPAWKRKEQAELAEMSRRF